MLKMIRVCAGFWMALRCWVVRRGISKPRVEGCGIWCNSADADVLGAEGVSQARVEQNKEEQSRAPSLLDVHN